jgi:hypothetical protein
MHQSPVARLRIIGHHRHNIKPRMMRIARMFESGKQEARKGVLKEILCFSGLVNLTSQDAEPYSLSVLSASCAVEFFIVKCFKPATR